MYNFFRIKTKNKLKINQFKNFGKKLLFKGNFTKKNSEKVEFLDIIVKVDNFLFLHILIPLSE